MDEVSQKMLGLALGGGAYRGVAHLGVLKAFEEEGLKPGFLSGTSSGGLAAAFYAFGMPLEEIRDLGDKLHWLRVSTLNVPRLGLLNNSELGRFVEKHLGSKNIEESPIPLALVTCDISTGEKIVLKTGSLSQALMATTCIPGVFSPVQEGERMLVDGALVENVPLTVLKEMGASVRVGVSLGSESYRKPENMIQVIINAINIATDQTNLASEGKFDFILKPQLESYGFLDNGNSLKLFAEGYRSGMMALEKVRSMLDEAGPSSLEQVEAKFLKWLRG